MTELLEKAIAAIRDLPDSGQNEAAEVMLAFAGRARGPVILDEEPRRTVKEEREQARRGEIASNAEMAAFFRRPR